MNSIQEYVKEWMKLGYTKEQSKEFARLSKFGANNNIEDVNSASESLINAMKQFELDNEDKTREIVEKLNEI